MLENNEELCLLTEVGVFGELDIEDPTKKKIKKKDDLETLIESSVKTNLDNLSK